MVNSAAAGHYSGEYSEYSSTQLLNYLASLLRPLVPSVCSLPQAVRIMT